VDFLDNALDRSSGTIRLRAVVANPDGFISPGMFGQLRLYALQPFDALLVPDQAIVTDQTRQVVYVVDAEGMVLGRLATEVARIIRGKHKPTFTPHMDTGDNVIVINASKVRVTGKKAEQKRYFRHTGYMGHERFTPFETMIEKHPERVIEKAVYGMLPKTALGRQVLRRKLRVFAGDKHDHSAQTPKVLDLKKDDSK
jgi:large subunit ribosomal protein L13